MSVRLLDFSAPPADRSRSPSDYSEQFAYPQLELEERYPEATALFVAGAAGDQPPWPKGTLTRARQYGEQLAAAVERVLQEDMKSLESTLATGYKEVTLELSERPTEAELKRSIQTHSGYQEWWARHLLTRVQAGEDIRTSYPDPVQM